MNDNTSSKDDISLVDRRRLLAFFLPVETERWIIITAAAAAADSILFPRDERQIPSASRRYPFIIFSVVCEFRLDISINNVEIVMRTLYRPTCACQLCALNDLASLFIRGECLMAFFSFVCDVNKIRYNRRPEEFSAIVNRSSIHSRYICVITQRFRNDYRHTCLCRWE